MSSRSSSGSGRCDGSCGRTLGAELARHRYPDSPRRIRVLRCQRELQRHECRSCGSFLWNRHDNPLTRVSATLSSDPPQRRRNPGIRCAATLLAASSDIRKKPPGSALLGRLGSMPRIGYDDHTSKTGDVEMKGLSSTLQTSTDQRGRDRTVIPWPAGRLEPSHQSVNNPLTRVSATLSRTLSETLQLQVRHNVREREHHLPAGDTRKKRTWK